MRKTVLGVIGPKDIVQNVVGVAQSYAELEAIPLPCRALTEVPEIARQHQPDVDILLFTSPVVAFCCTQQVELKVPFVSIPFSPSSLYRAIFHARHLLGPDGANISVDGLSQDKAAAALHDLGLPTGPVYALELTDASSWEQIVNFHLELWQQGKTHAIFTYYRAGYQALKALGAPVFLMDHEVPVIHQALQMVLLESKAMRSKDAQLMFGLIELDGFADICKELGSEYEVRRLKLRLQNEILNLIQPMSGVLFTEPGFVVVTTRGVVEARSLKFTQPIFSRAIYQEFGVSVSEGWGAGPVADTARQHAEVALRFAQQEGGGCAFVVLDDTQCLGPLGKREQESVRLKNVDPTVLALAENAGVSVRTIERLRFLARKMARSEVTSDEVAQELHVTERSARRVLQKLMTAGIVSVGGQDFSYPRGRPRRVFLMHPPLI